MITADQGTPPGAKISAGSSATATRSKARSARISRRSSRQPSAARPCRIRRTTSGSVFIENPARSPAGRPARTCPSASASTPVARASTWPQAQVTIVAALVPLAAAAASSAPATAAPSVAATRTRPLSPKSTRAAATP
jgi:hypothetical protein